MTRRRRTIATTGGLWLVPFLVMLPSLLTRVHAGVSSGQSSTSGSRAVTTDTNIEGCFQDFSTMLQIQMQPPLANNLHCRTLCAQHDFSMSATSGRVCHCGNNYPAIWYQVDPSLCDFPCNPDKPFCEGMGCCGSEDGVHYSVTFGKPIDVMLQLLRQLAYDYREHAPSFRNYVEKKLTKAAVLQVATSVGTAAQGGMGAVSSSMASNSGSVGFSTGCPSGWNLFKKNCYRRYLGKLSTYSTAQSMCKSQGGQLPIVSGKDENDYISNMMSGQASWLGMARRDSSSSWEWDTYSTWAPGEPSTNGQITSSPLFGPGGGTAFDDYVEGITGISSISIGMSNILDAVQVVYTTLDGGIFTGPVRGTFTRGSTTQQVTVASGQFISKVEGASGNNGITALSFTVSDNQGGSKVYGPYGQGSGRDTTFTYNPNNPLVGIMGQTDRNSVLQLGFREKDIGRCTSVDENGNWKAVSCKDKQNGMTFMCERKPTKSKVDCPDGWQSYGSSCYQGNSANAVSWDDADNYCTSIGGTLATVNSPNQAQDLTKMMGGRGFIGFKDTSMRQGPDRKWGWQRFTRWGSGQPAPMASGQTCTSMNSDGWWETVDCQTSTHQTTTVCETDPIDALCTCPSGWDSWECSCYKNVATIDPMVSWQGASAACANAGQSSAGGVVGRLVDVRSNEENDYVRKRAKGRAVHVGLGDNLSSGRLSSNYYSNWAATASSADQKCVSMRGDGGWLPTACNNQFNSYVCQLSGISTSTELRPVNSGDPVIMEPVKPDGANWGEPLQVRFRQTSNNATLAMNGDGRVYQTYQYTNESIFEVLTIPNTNTFLIRSTAYGNYVNYDSTTGGLKGMETQVDTEAFDVDTEVTGTAVDDLSNAPDSYMKGRFGAKTASSKAPSGKRRRRLVREKDGLVHYVYEGEEEEEEDGDEDGAPSRRLGPVALGANGMPITSATAVQFNQLPASAFTSSAPFLALAKQNLQISVAAYNQETMKSPKLCTIFIYDLTPNTDSYTCYLVSGDTSSLPYTQMEVAAWITQDKTSTLQPRTPLENGRTRCENASPTETATCNAAYGEGLTFQREFDVAFGGTFQWYFQIDIFAFQAVGVGGYYNFLMAYTSTYTTQYTQAYTETRNWAVTIPVSPQSVSTVQFWLSTINIRYGWQAILNAVGAFDVSSMGLYLSQGQSLTALSALENLFFYNFGVYSFPDQAEIIITVDNVENQAYPFDVTDNDSTS